MKTALLNKTYVLATEMLSDWQAIFKVLESPQKLYGPVSAPYPKHEDHPLLRSHIEILAARVSIFTRLPDVRTPIMNRAR